MEGLVPHEREFHWWRARQRHVVCAVHLRTTQAWKGPVDGLQNYRRRVCDRASESTETGTFVTFPVRTAVAVAFGDASFVVTTVLHLPFLSSRTRLKKSRSIGWTRSGRSSCGQCPTWSHPCTRSTEEFQRVNASTRNPGVHGSSLP